MTSADDGPATKAGIKADIKAISRRWHEAWGTEDITAAYAECLAPEFRALFFGQGWIDRDTYVRLDQEFARGFEDIRITVEESVAEGDLVMCRLTWRGRHAGDLPGMPATHKRFEIGGFAQDRFRGGRVIEHRPLFDQAELLRQLGLSRASPAAGASDRRRSPAAAAGASVVAPESLAPPVARESELPITEDLGRMRGMRR